MSQTPQQIRAEEFRRKVQFAASDLKNKKAKNIAIAIDDLYRRHAPPRDHDRLVELVNHQIRHAMQLVVGTVTGVHRLESDDE